MEPTLGAFDAIEFSDPGLSFWEACRQWRGTDNDDRAVLLSQLYLGFGSLLAALGSYGEALASFRRGLTFTGASAPDLARRAAPVLQVSVAAALLERGDLSAAEHEMALLTATIDERIDPTLAVRCREIRGKLALLRGDFGAAQALLQGTVDLCSEHRFLLAEARARLNLANTLVFLNKTRESQSHVDRAVDIAHRLDDEGCLLNAHSPC